MRIVYTAVSKGGGGGEIIISRKRVIFMQSITQWSYPSQPQTFNFVYSIYLNKFSFNFHPVPVRRRRLGGRARNI